MEERRGKSCLQATQLDNIRYRIAGFSKVVVCSNVNSNFMICVRSSTTKSQALDCIVQFLGAISVGDAYFGEGSGPVLQYIDCAGTELNVTQCSRGSVGQRNCYHGKDVGVICQGILA